ncbi:hypothetical protein G6F53_013811 [Rhizopus delemar]|nr:hypothetical protein G6F53_013811 [Rhizopus delemar]
MGEQIELLEHKADLLAQRIQIRALGVDVRAVDQDAALFDGLQAVDRADHGGLARPRRPAHHQHFAARHRQVHVLQHVMRAVPLVHFFKIDHVCPCFKPWRASGGYAGPASSSRGSG